MKVKILEPETKFIPIRLAYFTGDFWQQWSELEQSQREVYIMGWLAKLDHTMARLDDKLKELQEGGIERDRDRCVE